MARWRSALGAAVVLAAAVAAACAAGTTGVLPAATAIEGWRLREAPRGYSSENLYEYIDGNADLFLAYGFADVAVGDYTPVTGSGWISVDVYNMGTPLHAFGIFGAEKPAQARSAGLGAQGYASDGLIAFWQGPYYVKVSLIEGAEGAAARKLAEAASARIGAGMPLPQAMPKELARLPVANRIAGSERYVKKGALGHEFLVEVVSAEYGIKESRPVGQDPRLLPDSPGQDALGARSGQETRSCPTVTLNIADLGTREKATAGLAKLRKFEADAGEVADIAGTGEGAFAARDSYYGEMVVAQAGRFLIIGASERATREAVSELVTAGMATVERDGQASASDT
jgi:hypothetical protein